MTDRRTITPEMVRLEKKMDKLLNTFEAHDKLDATREVQNSLKFDQYHILFGSFHDTLKEIQLTLKPISETYTTATNLKKWGMGLLVLVSIVVGIILGVLKIFYHK